MSRSSAFGLFDDPGTGKTLGTLYAVEAAIATGKVDGAVIICPASVCGEWVKAIKQHIPGATCCLLQGQERRKRCFTKARYHVLNYELLNRCSAQRVKGKWVVRGKDIAALVRFAQARRVVLILDESHRVKNPNANATRVLMATRGAFPVRYCLTATPQETPEDIWSQMYILDGGRRFCTTFRAFLDTFTLYRDIRTPWGHKRQVYGYKDRKRFAHLLGSISLRRSKAQCIDLPPKVYTSRCCTPKGQQKRLLDTLYSEVMQELDAVKSSRVSLMPTANTPLVQKLALLQRAATAPELIDSSIRENAKLDMIVEGQQEYGQRKRIIWCLHRNVVEVFAKSLHGSVYVHGGMPMAERLRCIERWASSDLIYLVATIDSLKEGINALTCASIATYAEIDSRVIAWAQSQDRIHRIGQTQSVLIERLIMPHTLDAFFSERLDAKELLSRQSIDALSTKRLRERLKD